MFPRLKHTYLNRVFPASYVWLPEYHPAVGFFSACKDQSIFVDIVIPKKIETVEFSPSTGRDSLFYLFGTAKKMDKIRGCHDFRRHPIWNDSTILIVPNMQTQESWMSDAYIPSRARQLIKQISAPSIHHVHQQVSIAVQSTKPWEMPRDSWPKWPKWLVMRLPASPEKNTWTWVSLPGTPRFISTQKCLI